MLLPLAPDQRGSYVIAWLFIAAAFTDILDGWLARRGQQVTSIGKLLDPLADKLTVSTALIVMVSMGRIPDWATWMVVVIVGRELAVTGLRSVASSEGLVIPARQLGKRKTALQMIGILCLIIHFRYPILLTSHYVDFHLIGLYVIYISLVFSIFSAVEYIMLFARAVQDPRRFKKPNDGQAQELTED